MDEKNFYIFDLHLHEKSTSISFIPRFPTRPIYAGAQLSLARTVVLRRMLNVRDISRASSRNTLYELVTIKITTRRTRIRNLNCTVGLFSPVKIRRTECMFKDSIKLQIYDRGVRSVNDMMFVREREKEREVVLFHSIHLQLK